MLIEHQGKRPNIDSTACIAPTAVICGDMTI
jgi:carbonic anhydrase/acetyltransferase-like protein (isoleucine patch superfamily)